MRILCLAYSIAIIKNYFKIVIILDQGRGKEKYSDIFNVFFVSK